MDTAEGLSVEERIAALGLALPEPGVVPPGVTLPFSWVRVRGDRAYASGHGPLNRDGTMAPPFGKVPSEVSLEQAQAAAKSATLALIASLHRALGGLERVTAWLTLTGCVNADPSYPQTTLVFNPASELIIDLFGEDRGRHARTALGYAALPFNLPVIVAAEVEISD